MATTVAIAASSSGDNTVVVAASGFKFRVIAFVLSFSGSVNAKWKSGASTDKTGLMYGAAAAQVPSPALPPAAGNIPGAQFVTDAGEALVLNLSGATAVGGYVVYEKIPASS